VILHLTTKFISSSSKYEPTFVFQLDVASLSASRACRGCEHIPTQPLHVSDRNLVAPIPCNSELQNVGQDIATARSTDALFLQNVEKGFSLQMSVNITLYRYKNNRNNQKCLSSSLFCEE
jgi:hypothetical protein